MSHLLDFALHIDKHLQTFALEHGALIYGLLFGIIFCETGLVVMPFLPGDSLLFAVGALSAQGLIRIELIIPLLMCAALIGTEAFFVKHGGKAIILARFVPIVRTFAPFTAGFGRMDYRRFLCYSLGGGLVWVLSFSIAGYFLGSIPIIKNNLKLVFVLIIVVSLLPIVFEVLKHRAEAKKAQAEKSGES